MENYCYDSSMQTEKVVSPILLNAQDLQVLLQIGWDKAYALMHAKGFPSIKSVDATMSRRRSCTSGLTSTHTEHLFYDLIAGAICPGKIFRNGGNFMEKKRNAKGEGSFTVNPDGTVTHQKSVGYKANRRRKLQLMYKWEIRLPSFAIAIFKA